MSLLNFDELKEIIEINSWTKNKKGVDKNGEIFTLWMEEIGYKLTRYGREEIGDHLHFTAPAKEERGFCSWDTLIRFSRLILLRHSRKTKRGSTGPAYAI